jgi:uncharacterized repeat protein (TIGR01451 family)
MKSHNTKRFFTIFAAALCVLVLALAGTAAAKSVYVVPAHHTGNFQAYNINADGTVTYQATYGVTVNSPSGMAVYDDKNVNTVFITSEFSAGIHMFDGKNLATIGTVTTYLPSNLAGIDVDEANNIVYALSKRSRYLYICDFDPSLLPSTSALQPRPGYITLPGMSYGYGISFDDATGLLWIADAGSDMARAYDPSTWTEVVSEGFSPVAPGLIPIDIDVDSVRSAVYTVCMARGGGTPGASTCLSRFDLITRTEQVIDMGAYGVGVSADEVSGLVYVTCQPNTLNVWDPYAVPPTRIDQVLFTGGSAPAGVAVGPGYVPNVYVEKDDGDGQDDDLSVCPGDIITYTMDYGNSGNAAASGVVLTDTLPPEVTVVDAGGGIYDVVTGTINWNLGTLQPLASGNVTVIVQVDPSLTPPATITNFATIEHSVPYSKMTDFEQTDVVQCDVADLWAVEYGWGEPAPGYSLANWPIFEGWMDVRIENRGAGDAFNVTGEVMTWPINTTVPDTDVTVGDIPAGGSAWSVDTFTTHVDMANLVDPCEEVFWRIEYDDAAGVHHVVENVPEFPPGEGPPQCP